MAHMAALENQANQAVTDPNQSFVTQTNRYSKVPKNIIQESLSGGQPRGCPLFLLMSAPPRFF